MKKTPKIILILCLLLFFVLLIALFFNNIMQNDINPDRYNQIIDKASKKHNVPASLIKAVIWKESKFDPNVTGAAGEIGLMQIMPGAVEDWKKGTKTNKTPSKKELFNPELNIEIGSWYLAWTGKHWENYKSKLILQISEYNAGYGNVTKKWKPASPGDEVKLDNIKINSTKKYVRDVINKMKEYDNAKKSP